jgi:predicted Zn-dependent protease with MMP-like domain
MSINVFARGIMALLDWENQPCGYAECAKPNAQIVAKPWPRPILFAMDSNATDWDDLQLLAEEEVREIVRSLPPELQERAAKLPLCFEIAPNEKWIEDGIEPDTLGLFVGEAFPDGIFGGALLPAQIILFLGNLWEMAEEDEETFLFEVRRTYLHELGHFLGLDELGLEERGLD